jgi:hypothetical protein
MTPTVAAAHASSDSAPRPIGLWFGLLAPPIAWIAQGLGSVWVTTQACHHPGDTRLARSVVMGLALGALAVTLAASSYARRQLGRSAGQPRRKMMAIGGIFLAVTLGLGILWAGLPALLLGKICEATR